MLYNVYIISTDICTVVYVIYIYYIYKGSCGPPAPNWVGVRYFNREEPEADKTVSISPMVICVDLGHRVW